LKQTIAYTRALLSICPSLSVCLSVCLPAELKYKLLIRYSILHLFMEILSVCLSAELKYKLLIHYSILHLFMEKEEDMLRQTTHYTHNPTYTQEYPHTCVYTHIHKHNQMRIFIHIYIETCMHIHTYIYTHTYKNVPSKLCACACAHSHDSRDEHTQENLERKNNVPFRNVFAHNSYTSIHSFTQAISIAPLQVHYYSEALPTQHGCSVEVSRRSTTGNRQSKYR